MNLQESVVPITIQQGADFTLPVQFLDSNGQPVSLSGAAAVFTVRSSFTATDIIAQCSIAGGGITVNVLQGVLTINLTAAVTAALIAPATGIYNLLVTSPIGVKARALQGPVTITAEVPS